MSHFVTSDGPATSSAAAVTCWQAARPRPVLLGRRTFLGVKHSSPRKEFEVKVELCDEYEVEVEPDDEYEIEVQPDDEYEVEVEPDEEYEVEVEPDDEHEVEAEPDEQMYDIDDLTCMPQGLFQELLASGARARARNQHMLVRHAKSSKRNELVQFDTCVASTLEGPAMSTSAAAKCWQAAICSEDEPQTLPSTPYHEPLPSREPRTLSPTPVHRPSFTGEPRTLSPTPHHQPFSPPPLSPLSLTEDLIAKLGEALQRREEDWSPRKAQSCTSTEALTPMSDLWLDADGAFIHVWSDGEEELDIQAEFDDEYEVEVEPDEEHEVEVEPDDEHEVDADSDEQMCDIDDLTCMPQGLFQELLASGARARARNQHLFIRHAKSSKLNELVQFDLCVVG